MRLIMQRHMDGKCGRLPARTTSDHMQTAHYAILGRRDTVVLRVLVNMTPSKSIEVAWVLVVCWRGDTVSQKSVQAHSVYTPKVNPLSLELSMKKYVIQVHTPPTAKKLFRGAYIKRSWTAFSFILRTMPVNQWNPCH